MQTDEVVVTKFDLSAKEQTLKSRFLANQRTTGSVQPTQTVRTQQYPPDPQLDTFLKDMQESMRQQPVGALAGELLKKQANMMQQQIDLLRENQSANQTLIQNLAKQTAADPKRAVAELMAPIMSQLKEIYNLHRDTKQSAELLGLQLQQLKLDVDTKAKAPDQARDTVQGSMDKFALKKAMFQQKVAEAQRLVDQAAVQDGGIAAATEGIKYLQSQMQEIQRDTELVERDLQSRFQRIVEQCQRVKSLPQEVLYPVSNFETARERLLKRLGGVFDYDQLTVDLDRLLAERNQIAQEFARTAPNYPTIIRPQVAVQQAESKPAAKRTKVMKPAPVPMVQTKRTLTKKPSNITEIISDPQNAPPLVSKVKTPRPKVKTPRTEPEKTVKPPMVSQEVQAEVQRDTRKMLPAVTSPDEELSISLEERKGMEPPAPAQPQPFQLAESLLPQKKRIQPDDLMPSIYSPPVVPPKPVETIAPPRVNWEKQTVDAVTEYFLAQKLISGSAQRRPNLGAMGRWLGPDQLELLIKEGIFVDSGTIERMGLEVLDDVIARAKLDVSRAKEAERSVAQESEEKYGSDFEKVEDEEVISEHSDHSFEVVPPAINPPAISQEEPPIDRSISFSKISPRKDFPSPESRFPDTDARPANDITALFNPAILSKMSPAAVQQYVNSLIEAGHIGPRTENTGEVARSQVFVQQVEERKEPQREELEQLLGPQMAEVLIQTLREQHQAMTQEMVERFAKSFAPQLPSEKLQPEKLPSPRTVPHTEKTVTEQSQSLLFKDAFSIPKRLNLDLDAEEAKLLAEQNMPRVLLQLPPFRPPEPPLETGSNLSLFLSASESSLGGKSIGTDIFSLDNTEYMGSLAQFLHAAGNMEEGQLAGNMDLSEGEVGMGDEGLSSGEIPPDVLAPSPVSSFPRPRVNVADIMGSEDPLEGSSEGEFDPRLLFRP